jgi:hypothetical protein
MEQGVESTRYEYKVVYVIAWESISVEGQETRREQGERNSAFGRRVLNELGADGWELAGLHPTLDRPQAAYYVFKRLLAPGTEPDLSVVRREEQAPQPAAPAQPSQPAPHAPPTSSDVVSL